MNRVEEANKMMQKLGVKENSLAKSFDEFETVKNNFIYGEVWNQGNMDEKLRSIVTVAVLTTVEGKDLEEQIRVALNNWSKATRTFRSFSSRGSVHWICKS